MGDDLLRQGDILVTFESGRTTISKISVESHLQIPSQVFILDQKAGLKIVEHGMDIQVRRTQQDGVLIVPGHLGMHVTMGVAKYPAPGTHQPVNGDHIRKVHRADTGLVGEEHIDLHPLFCLRAQGIQDRLVRKEIPGS